MADPRSSPPYGKVEWLSPLVRRVLAHNPSPLTHSGTGTYIVGRGTVAIIDPGPDDPAHVEALAAAIAGETASHLLVTHTHIDHSPAARLLQRRVGGRIAGCRPLAAGTVSGAGDAFDPHYAPDLVLEDGEAVSGPGWTLRALATPGHTSNHLCFAFPEEETLFSGDHVMGWSTTVVFPPDGDMAAYRRSLELLLHRNERRYLPTHGPAIDEPQRLVRGLVVHRQHRERQIRQLLSEDGMTVGEIVRRLYATVGPGLQQAAGGSVLAHLLDLEARGLARRSGARWQAGIRSSSSG